MNEQKLKIKKIFKWSDIDLHDFYLIAYETHIIIDPSLSPVDIAKIIAVYLDYQHEYDYFRPCMISVGNDIIFDYFAGVITND